MVRTVWERGTFCLVLTVPHDRLRVNTWVKVKVRVGRGIGMVRVNPPFLEESSQRWMNKCVCVCGGVIKEKGEKKKRD